MKRLLAAALSCTAACDAYLPPVIESFTVDNANPQVGAPVQLHYAVRDAAIVSIVPEPGEVTSSPVLVQPRGPTTYTLRAGNVTGWVQKDLVVNPHASAGAAVAQFSLVPSQAAAGTPRQMKWDVKEAVVVTVGPANGAQLSVAHSGEVTVNPDKTTTYVLSAVSAAGYATASARAVARVVSPTQITTFAAAPPSILQGDPATLGWSGSALDWAISVNGVTTNLGVAKSLVVRPAATTTYSLTGKGPGGTAGPRQLTVSVTPRAGTKLVYTPAPSPSGPLQLVADSGCADPCTALTLRLVATSAVSLRGVALDLPLDSTKVSLDPATFATAFDAGKAVLGTGRLRETLVLGAAKKGTGAGPAADTSFAAGAEVARFVLALNPGGGQGIVFDGAKAFPAFVQSASRTPGGIAVGRLEAK